MRSVSTELDYGLLTHCETVYAKGQGSGSKLTKRGRKCCCKVVNVTSSERLLINCTHV